MAERDVGGRPGTRTRALSRRPVVVLVAVLAALMLAGTFGVAPAAAASDQLRLAVAATYRVDPAKRAVHVRMDVDATNQKADTASTIYYYNSVSFAVQPEATVLAARSNGSKLTVTAEKHESFREVTVRFPNLYHGKSRKIRVTFDLPSGAPRSDSQIRVGQAHTAFTAWAWGDAGLGDVRIDLPPHFIADVETVPAGTSDQLVSSSVAGRTHYAADDIEDPVAWYSSIEASNRDALTDVDVDVSGESVRIHAWPEDTEWLERVSTVLEDSLPDLEAAIGLAWPVDDDLEVTEVTSSELEGYAGFFDPSYDTITISEDLDDLVIVHEASHAWFDGRLFQERWIDEGLADEYASRILAADHVGDTKEGPEPVTADDEAAFALNGWRPPARIDDESADYERFGYDASWTVMRAIVDEVTEPRMRSVFKIAADQTLSYVGAGPAERSGFVPDWRRFLDLVTDVGGSKKAEGLLRTWVLRPAELSELDARKEARARYFQLVAAGGDWLPGVVIRKPMSNWRFPDAESAMTEAETVLRDRDALSAATEELALDMPAGLETAYETADATEDLEALDARIGEWSAAAAALRSARDALAGERPPLVEVGLFDTKPSAGYESALAAFAAGDDKAVLAGSAATVAALAGAEEIGRGRVTMGAVAVAVVLLLLLVIVVVAIRRHRRRRPVLAPAAAMWGPAASSDEPTMAAVAVAPDPWMGVAYAPPLNDPVSDLAVSPPDQAPDLAVPPPPVMQRRLDDPVPPPTVVPAAAPSLSHSPASPVDADAVPPLPSSVRRLDAEPTDPAGDPPDPYATLAAIPNPLHGNEVGEPGARGVEPD